MPLSPASNARTPRLGQPEPVPSPLQDQGCPPQKAGPLTRAPGHPPAPLRRCDPRGPGVGPGDHSHPPVLGSARTPPPPPGARSAGRATRLPANTGGHRLYGGPASAAPLGTTDNPRGPRALSPAPDWELWRDVWAASLTHPSPQCRWMATGPGLHGANATARPPLPSPPPPCRALHSAAHGTTQMHQEVVERARLPPGMPTRITVMLDSEGSPQRDDRQHRRSRSRSPVSPGCAGETLAECEERRLAEAAVPVVPPAWQPRAARADTELLTRGPAPASRTAPAAQAASPAVPFPEGAPGAQGAEPQQAAPRPRPRQAARRQRGGWPRRGPRAPRREPPQARQRAGRARSTAPTQTPATPTPAPRSRTPPKGRLPYGKAAAPKPPGA